TRGETCVVGGFVFCVGAGSVLVFLASQFWAYHEAELWGAALALGGFVRILAYVVKPTRRRLFWASGFTLLALLARGATGLGPLVALGLVLVAQRWPWS